MSAIHTPRLELRLLARADAPDVYAYARDPAVAADTAWEPHRSVRDAEAYVTFVLSRHASHPDMVHHVWGIRLRGDERVVGTVDFVQDSTTAGHVDYALARSHWGRGYMSEAVQAVVGWGFANVPELVELRSSCLARNRGSVRVLEKAGFTEATRERMGAGHKAAHEGLELINFRLARP